MASATAAILARPIERSFAFTCTPVVLQTDRPYSEDGRRGGIVSAVGERLVAGRGEIQPPPGLAGRFLRAVVEVRPGWRRRLRERLLVGRRARRADFGALD